MPSERECLSVQLLRLKLANLQVSFLCRGALPVLSGVPDFVGDNEGMGCAGLLGEDVCLTICLKAWPCSQNCTDSALQF